MEKLRQAVQELLLLAESDFNTTDIYHKIAINFHELCLAIIDAEKNEYASETIATTVGAARKLLSQSPLVKRMQEWPCDYQDDFVTNEYLFTVENNAPTDTFAYCYENFCLTSAIAQDVRSQVHHQIRSIINAIYTASDDCDILSLRSSNGREFYQLQQCIHKYKANLVINDIDSKAIEFTRERLANIDGQCQYLSGDPVRMIQVFHESGPYDLVILNSLLNYIDDQAVIFILQNLCERVLKKDGKIIFSNTQKNNVFRPWLEYLVNWKKYERSEEDIKNLLHNANLSNATLSSRMNFSGLSRVYLLEY